MKLPVLVIVYAIANFLYDYMMNLLDGMTYSEAWLSLGTYFIMLSSTEYIVLLTALLILIVSMFAPSIKQLLASSASMQRLTAQWGSPSGKETPRKD
ncbi:hypothetical protein FHS16_005201 [Paenibacillus endophyticus]|uniref:Uncharacterized protein n=1 Tax=Paenibacillus endophyticus TaxID=1294268 RepID=A0A7W5GC82_9BACL|nr:hypothetical protein [Paenibacillus endophyticus]MBB3155094.1 hypothetical protein [Paenibacillus endophyticus]